MRSGIFDACRQKLGPMFLSSHLGEAFSSVNPASAVGTGMVRKVRCGMHQLGPLLPLLSSLLPSGTSFSTCLLLPPHPTSPPLLSPPLRDFILKGLNPPELELLPITAVGPAAEAAAAGPSAAAAEALGEGSEVEAGAVMTACPAAVAMEE